MEEDVTERLRALARQHGTTLFSMLLAVYQTLLHRYFGQEDLLVGAPDCRPEPEQSSRVSSATS